jgi:hypothetical protein
LKPWDVDRLSLDEFDLYVSAIEEMRRGSEDDGGVG